MRVVGGEASGAVHQGCVNAIVPGLFHKNVAIGIIADDANHGDGEGSFKFK